MNISGKESNNLRRQLFRRFWRICKLNSCGNLLWSITKNSTSWFVRFFMRSSFCTCTDVKNHTRTASKHNTLGLYYDFCFCYANSGHTDFQWQQIDLSTIKECRCLPVLQHSRTICRNEPRSNSPTKILLNEENDLLTTAEVGSPRRRLLDNISFV